MNCKTVTYKMSLFAFTYNNIQLACKKYLTFSRVLMHSQNSAAAAFKLQNAFDSYELLPKITNAEPNIIQKGNTKFSILIQVNS